MQASPPNSFLPLSLSCDRFFALCASPCNRNQVDDFKRRYLALVGLTEGPSVKVSISVEDGSQAGAAENNVRSLSATVLTSTFNLSFTESPKAEPRRELANAPSPPPLPFPPGLPPLPPGQVFVMSFEDLQSAVATASQPGDSVNITIVPGTMISFPTKLEIKEGTRVVIACASPAGATFDGALSTRLFDIYGSLTLLQITLARGSAQYGGGLFLNAGAEALLLKATIQGCEAVIPTDATSGNAFGGGAYVATGAVLALVDSRITGCNATNSAFGNFARGGAAYVLGAFTLVRSVIDLNAARHSVTPTSAQGGGIFVAAGQLLMNEATLLRGNKADGLGDALYADGGVSTYTLPAPAGHYISGLKCMVYREACERDTKGNIIDADCPGSVKDCAELVGDDASVVTSSGATVLCRPRLLNQPCNWESTPELIGKVVQSLPLAPLEGDYPSACAAGVLGSSDMSGQESALCAGLCPPGKLCANEGTIAPTDCPAGKVCPEGTSVPLPCDGGTYSNRIGLTSKAECTACPEGSSCSPGSTIHTLCSPGSYASTIGLESCLPCTAGTYQPEPGTTACISCAQGSYCPEGAAATLACLEGTFSSTSNLASASGCEPCPTGHACAAGTVEPQRCSPGTYASSTGNPSCSECVLGVGFNSKFGQSECSICPAGSYSTNILSCTPCPLGEWCAQGVSMGTPCALVDGTTLGEGASSEAECVCKASLYMRLNEAGNRACVECPMGVDCDSAGVTLEKLPIEPGYWRASDSSAVVLTCYIGEACIGGTNLSDYCDAAYVGPFCNECALGFHKSSINRCEKCEGSLLVPALVLGLTPVLIMLLGGCYYYTREGFESVGVDPKKLNSKLALKWRKVGEKKPRHGVELSRAEKLIEALDQEKTKFTQFTQEEWRNFNINVPVDRNTVVKVGSAYYQPASCRQWLSSSFSEFTHNHQAKVRTLVALIQVMISLAMVFDIQWPPFYKHLLNILGIFAFDFIDVMPFDCVIPTNFHTNLFFRTVWPLLFLLVAELKRRRLLGQVEEANKTSWPISRALTRSVTRRKEKKAETTTKKADLLLSVETSAGEEKKEKKAETKSVGTSAGEEKKEKKAETTKKKADLLLSVIFAIFFLIYPTTSAKIFATFQCYELDNEERSRFLRADLSVDCKTDVHQLMTVYASFMVFVYPLGMPLLYVYLLFYRCESACRSNTKPLCALLA